MLTSRSACWAGRAPGSWQFAQRPNEKPGLALKADNQVCETIAMQDLAVGLLGSAAATLKQIETALERMDAGGYGRCLECGDKIPQARLEAVPYATRCVQCAARKSESPEIQEHDHENARLARTTVSAGGDLERQRREFRTILGERNQGGVVPVRIAGRGKRKLPHPPGREHRPRLALLLARHLARPGLRLPRAWSP